MIGMSFVVFAKLKLSWSKATTQGSKTSRHNSVKQAPGTMRDGPSFFGPSISLCRRRPLPAPEAPTVDHLCFMVTRQVDTLLARDPGARLGGASDDVHQMRVAARRLRAVLRAAKPLLLPTWSEPLSVDSHGLENCWTRGDLDVDSTFEREAKTLIAAIELLSSGLSGGFAVSGN